MHLQQKLYLREIREKKGIAIDHLAKILRMDQRLLQQMEDQEFVPSVSDLLRIAGVLGTDIAALIYGRESSEKKTMVTRRDSRIQVDRMKGLRYESLTPFYSGRRMEPFMIELNRNETRAADVSKHAGEEFHFVFEGRVKITVDGASHILETGDCIYFDSSHPHTVEAASPAAKLIAVLYNGESMLHLTQSKYMRDIIHAAKLLGGRNMAVACPDKTSLDAINKGIEEGVIKTAYLVGSRRSLPEQSLLYPSNYHFKELDDTTENYFAEAAGVATALARNGECQMVMKGHLNTAVFAKAVLNKEKGINTGRRLSLISLFELPEIDRLIFLTDPGINTALVSDNNLESSMDIIKNAIELAKGLGVGRPKVALLEANEVPSSNIPSTMYEKQLSDMQWSNADVFGPLSYDIALYEDAAKAKGFPNHPVAGRADILVVPYISGGNFLYKAWAYTMNAEVANLVIGAKVPLIITSRTDTEKTKFLTICACSVYYQSVKG